MAPVLPVQCVCVCVHFYILVNTISPIPLWMQYTRFADTTNCGREFHILTAQTVKNPLGSLRLNCFPCSFNDWPTVFLSDLKLNSFLPMLEWPFRFFYIAIISQFKSLFYKENKFNVCSGSLELRSSSPLISFVALLWTHPSWGLVTRTY